MNNNNNGGGGGRSGLPSSSSARKRSRTNSNASAPGGSSASSLMTHPSNNNATATSSSSNGNNGNNSSPSSRFIPDKDNHRLLRLNVGGHPYDVVRTSLPLLETMMTDRWLVGACSGGCLTDADGRVFIDRDGDAFGDVLRYLRGGSEFLEELLCSSSLLSSNGGWGVTQQLTNNGGIDRLRRLRTEADYYGLQELVHEIDAVTIGRKVVFVDCGWGRVAGRCLSRNHHRRRQQQQQQQPPQQPNLPQEENNNNAAAALAEEADLVNNDDEEDVDEDDNHSDNDEEEDDDDEEEEDVEDEEEVEDEIDDDDDESVIRDDDQLPPYKHWSWSQQYGNPDILKPHPKHTSSMIVGQDGSYLLLLRLAAALPSPLARIKWDQEEEEGRRVTRGGRVATRSNNRRSNHNNNHNNNHNDDDDEDDANINNAESQGGGNVSRRSNELEEDYFVTVNIEAPLQTVMDSVDESQTHFPLLRAGLWDYRTEEEVTNEDPVFATFCGVDVVSLRAGDILSVSFMNDDISRERAPFPDNAPPDLVNSLTLVKVYGNTMARYERLKLLPNDIDASLLVDKTRRVGGIGIDGQGLGGGVGHGGSSAHTSPTSRGKTPTSNSNNHDDNLADDDSFQNQLDCEAEEFDRSLTRTARWLSPRNDFHPTPFHPVLHSHSSIIQFSHPGHYLLLGRVALGCRRDATFDSVLSGGPIEGHRAQLSVRSVGGRLLHAVGFVFEDKPRLEWADLSILSENAMFNDVVHVPKAGTEISITATGDCRLHPEGTEVGPFCSAVSQSLSCLLLDDEVMEGKNKMQKVYVVY